jgi:hypothetical protein
MSYTDAIALLEPRLEASTLADRPIAPAGDSTPPSKKKTAVAPRLSARHNSACLTPPISAQSSAPPTCFLSGRVTWPHIPFSHDRSFQQALTRSFLGGNDRSHDPPAASAATTFLQRLHLSAAKLPRRGLGVWSTLEKTPAPSATWPSRLGDPQAANSRCSIGETEAANSRCSIGETDVGFLYLARPRLWFCE